MGHAGWPTPSADEPVHEALEPGDAAALDEDGVVLVELAEGLEGVVEDATSSAP